MSFGDGLRVSGKTILANMLTARRQLILGVGGAIIDGTPVKTGALKGSWYTTLDTPSGDATPRLDSTGEAPKAELASTQIDLTTDVFLTNNLDYAEAIEYGHSQQAPAGMVRVNTMGIEGITFNLETN